MSSAKLFSIRRNRNKPGEKRSIFDKRLPFGNIPTHILRGRSRRARLAAEEYNNGVRLCGDKSKQENVFGTAVVAFKDRITEGRKGMKLDLLVSGAYKMVDDVGRSGIASRTAKPLVTSKTLDDAARRVDPAVPATC